MLEDQLCSVIVGLIIGEKLGYEEVFRAGIVNERQIETSKQLLKWVSLEYDSLSIMTNATPDQQTCKYLPHPRLQQYELK